MTHARCTSAERATRHLIAALEALKPHAIHPHLVEADLYEARMILSHLAEHTADLHAIGA